MLSKAIFAIGISSILKLVQSTELVSKCDGDEYILTIPYPDERTANVLYLSAGICNETDNVHKVEYDSNLMAAIVTIPITDCQLKHVEKYGIPLTRNSYDDSFAEGVLFQARANVTLGASFDNGMTIAVKSVEMAAECEKRTTYNVTFTYSGEISTDSTEECENNNNGTCLFPSYEDDVRLSIGEYTDGYFNVTTDNTTSQAVAGNTIYLQMGGSVYPGYKFAVAMCYILDSEGNEFELINPEEGTCAFSGIGFTGRYDKPANEQTPPNFNIEHVLFVLQNARKTGESEFTLKCSTEVCPNKETESKCNELAVPCFDNDRLKDEYLCHGLCDINSEDCIVDQNDVPSCIPRT